MRPRSISAAPAAPLLLLLPLLLSPPPAACVPVVFDNTAPVLDVRGAIVDAHDQSVQRFRPGGPYLRHAVAYGGCLEPAGTGCDRTNVSCGFMANHSIDVWSSPDLSSGSWTKVATAVAPAQRPPGVVFRPSAVYNENPGAVVLIWNFMSNGYPAAVSAPGDPAGPFVFATSDIRPTFSGESDFALFVDPSERGAGYIIYSAGFQIHIERLNDDFLGVRGAPLNYTFPEYFVEAPALFERKGTYYALFSWCCCFCKQGSGIIVHTAPHPLGPWTAQPVGPDYERGDVACVAKNASGGAAPATAAEAREGKEEGGGESASLAATAASQRRVGPLGTDPTPGLGCEYKNASETSSTRAQQNSVWLVDTADGSVEYLWVGDRWQQAPDGVKGHDPQTVLRLSFDDATGAVGLVRWVDNFTLDVV